MVSTLITAVLFVLFALVFGFTAETAESVQQATASGYSSVLCIIVATFCAVAAWIEA